MVEPRVPPGEQPPAGSWMLIALAMVIVMIVGQLAIVLLVNGWRGSVGEAIGQGCAGARRPSSSPRFPDLRAGHPAVFHPARRGRRRHQLPARSTGPIWASAGWLIVLLFLVVLIFVSVRLLPLMAVVASEGIGPFASLKRSFALTAGHFWRLFGFLILLMIAFLILAVTVGAVIGALVTLTLGEPEPWTLVAAADRACGWAGAGGVRDGLRGDAGPNLRPARRAARPAFLTSIEKASRLAPLGQRRQAHQDRVDVAAGLETEQRAAVIEQVEFDVSSRGIRASCRRPHR